MTTTQQWGFLPLPGQENETGTIYSQIALKSSSVESVERVPEKRHCEFKYSNRERLADWSIFASIAVILWPNSPAMNRLGNDAFRQSATSNGGPFSQ